MVERRTLLRLAIVESLFVGLGDAGAAAGLRGAPPHTPDKTVDLTAWGKVKGGVYDPTTGLPVPGATIAIRRQGKFETKGRTVAFTDSAGAFECEAELGRHLKRGDLFRLMDETSGNFDLPGSIAELRRTDVDQLALRVMAPGFRMFEGVVDCWLVRAKDFLVHLDPILLMPEGTSGASVAGDGWMPARVLEFRLTPGVVLPGEKVAAVATIRSPKPARDLKGKDHDYKVIVAIDDNTFHELKDRSDNGDGTFTFKGSFDAPKLPKGYSYRGWLPELNIIAPFAVLNPTRDAFLAVVSTDEGKASARERERAWNLWRSGDDGPAADAFAALAASASGLNFDSIQAGNLYGVLGKWEDAIPHFRQALNRNRNTSNAKRLMSALLKTGKVEEAVQVGTVAVAEIRNSTKDSDLAKHVGEDFMSSLGIAMLRSGRMSQARSFLALYSGSWPTVDEANVFFQEFKLKDADTVLQSSPQDRSALVLRAATLRDQGNWKVARDATEAAYSVAPNIPALIRDRVALALYDTNLEITMGAVEKAIDAAESIQNLRETPPVSSAEAFERAYFLGLLRLWRAGHLPPGGESVTEEFNRAHLAFDTALRHATIRDTHSLVDGPLLEGTLPYVKLTVHRYGTGIGAHVLDMQQAALVLRETPDDWLASEELAAALDKNEVVVLAELFAARALAGNPDSVPALFLRATLETKRGRTADAEAGLRAVLEKAPYHPHAALRLASLLEGKNPVEANQLLEDHARRYRIPPRPIPATPAASSGEG